MSMGVQIHLDMETRLFHLLCQTAQAACGLELEINQEEMHTYKKEVQSAMLLCVMSVGIPTSTEHMISSKL